ncbi:sensor histidine kinase [Paenibacillus enshidis]|uniref:histidine kinase n=1 Tax=Paenibacillus enshidis TaxID=1458439 RepID=A0ABV5AVJ8_9BACL
MVVGEWIDEKDDARMKWNRIYLKWGCTIFGLFMVILLLLGVVINQIFTNFYSTQTHEEANELAAHLSSMLEEQIIPFETMEEFTGVEIFLINNKGEFTYLSDAGNDRSVQHWPDVWSNEDLLEGRKFEKEFIYQNQLYLLHGIPVNIPSDSTIKGIYVISSLESMENSILTIRWLLVLAGVGTLILALGCIFILSKKLSDPLVKIEEATRKIAKGELDTQLHVPSKDEIGSLVQAINDLAKELKRYRDTRSEFFANISHELRTPVTYMQGYANILSKGYVEDEAEQQKYLHIISEESHRLTVIINDLFELAKMEEGKIELNMKLTDPAEIIRQSMDKVRLKAHEKELELSSHFEKVSSFYIDPVRFEQILLNLLENAIRYTATGSIRITLTQEGRQGIVAISDSGPGIPKDELPYIFERFYRVEKSRSRQLGGTGLGLSIVQHLVQLQGGKIEVDSQVGRGTVFKVMFPIGDLNS